MSASGGLVPALSRLHLACFGRQGGTSWRHDGLLVGYIGAIVSNGGNWWHPLAEVRVGCALSSQGASLSLCPARCPHTVGSVPHMELVGAALGVVTSLS